MSTKYVKIEKLTWTFSFNFKHFKFQFSFDKFVGSQNNFVLSYYFEIVKNKMEVLFWISLNFFYFLNGRKEKKPEKIHCDGYLLPKVPLFLSSIEDSKFKSILTSKIKNKENKTRKKRRVEWSWPGEEMSKK